MSFVTSSSWGQMDPRRSEDDPTRHAAIRLMDDSKGDWRVKASVGRAIGRPLTTLASLALMLLLSLAVIEAAHADRSR